MFVTFFDTCMVSLAALIVWKVNPIFVFFPWLTIACLDGLYLSSALIKVPDGAWFTLTLASVLASIFILWRFGKEKQWQAEAEDRFPTSHLVTASKDGQLRLKPKYGGESLSFIKGLGIFFDKSGETTPAVFSQFLSKLAAIPEVMIFFHLRPIEAPSVSPENRYSVSRLGIPNCYRIVVRHGYTDEVIAPNLAALLCEQVQKYIVTSGAILKHPNSPTTIVQTQDEQGSTQDEHDSSITIVETQDELDQTQNTNGSSTPPSQNEKVPKVREESQHSESTNNSQTDKSVAADLEKLLEAHDRKILYIIGKEQMRVRSGTSIWRKVLLRIFLWIRENTRTKIASLRVPTERVIEVGFVKDI